MSIENELELLGYEQGNWFISTQTGQAFMSAMPKMFRDAVLLMPDEVFDMEEEQLSEKAKCGVNEYAMRVAFWQEYERCLNGKTNTMSIHRMIRGMMDLGTIRRVIKNPYKLAWILKPVGSYVEDMEFMLVRGKERLWEILNMPIKQNGKFDARLAKVVLDAHKQIEDRVHGQTVQKQQQLQVRVHQKADAQTLSEVNEINGIDARIKQLEAEISAQSVPGFDGQHIQDDLRRVGYVEMEVKSGDEAERESELPDKGGSDDGCDEIHRSDLP